MVVAFEGVGRSPGALCLPPGPGLTDEVIAIRALRRLLVTSKAVESLEVAVMLCHSTLLNETDRSDERVGAPESDPPTETR